MAGIIYSDRKLGAEVRSLALKEIRTVLQGEKNEFYEAVLLRLTASVLPRLNEVTGADGDAMKITIEVAGSIANKNGIAPQPGSSSE